MMNNLIGLLDSLSVSARTINPFTERRWFDAAVNTNIYVLYPPSSLHSSHPFLSSFPLIPSSHPSPSM